MKKPTTVVDFFYSFNEVSGFFVFNVNNRIANTWNGIAAIKNSQIRG